ncbi:MAG TPA: hypothetical protein DCY88_07800 [Cyanobacteria bacterium UBA11372]|nr:hypothetical protein [Cyanobacteria bacterium UBA11372]
MSSSKFIAGADTIIRVAPLLDCDRVRPESIVITTGALATAGATSLTVTITGTPTPTQTILATTNFPLPLNFIEANGREHLVWVTASIDPTTITLTVQPLKRAIASGAIARFPVILRNRQQATFNPNNQNQDISVFDNAGWQDSLTTRLGRGLSMNGTYLPTDAGYNICIGVEFQKADLYWELEFPKPGCESDNLFTKGEIFWGFGSSQVSIESSADNMIMANIEVQSRGKVTRIMAV